MECIVHGVAESDMTEWLSHTHMSLVAQLVKNPTRNAGDPGSIPGSGRFPFVYSIRSYLGTKLTAMPDLLGIREHEGCGLDRCVCILPNTNIHLYTCTWREREREAVSLQGTMQPMWHSWTRLQLITTQFLLLVSWSIDFTIPIPILHFRLREFYTIVRHMYTWVMFSTMRAHFVCPLCLETKLDWFTSRGVWGCFWRTGAFEPKGSVKHEPLCRWTQEERKAEEGRVPSSLTWGLCSEKGQYND